MADGLDGADGVYVQCLVAEGHKPEQELVIILRLLAEGLIALEALQRVKAVIRRDAILTVGRQAVGVHVA